MDLKNKRFAFLGDSITQGSGASAPENMYVRVFERENGLEKAFNYGIGGTRIARQMTPSNEIFDQDYCSRFDKMENDVDAVVVFGGTNDFGHGDAPLGEFGDKTPDTFYGACAFLMEGLINKYPDTPIVFITPLHRLTENDIINEGGIRRNRLSDYVHAIKEMAEFYSIPVLDLFGEGGMQPNIEAQNKMYFSDGLHPNDKGHAKIAYMLQRYFTYKF